MIARIFNIIGFVFVLLLLAVGLIAASTGAWVDLLPLPTWHWLLDLAWAAWFWACVAGMALWVGRNAWQWWGERK